MSLRKKLEQGDELTDREWLELYTLALIRRRGSSTPEMNLIRCIFGTLSFNEFVRRGKLALSRRRLARLRGVEHIVRGLRSERCPGVVCYLPIDYYDPYAHPLGHTNGWEDTVRAYEEDR